MQSEEEASELGCNTLKSWWRRSKDIFPLLRIDESLKCLAGPSYFSSLDLASGYWQVGMDSQSQEKTTSTTPGGL